jgi:hypothetical protein
MALTREEILARKTGPKTEEYKLSDGSGTVTIRGLTRNEAIRIRDEQGGIDARDNLLISLGLVDPAMTPDDVAAWGDAEGQFVVMTDLSEAIGRLSGMVEGAGKSGVPRTGKRSRS